MDRRGIFSARKGGFEPEWLIYLVILAVMGYLLFVQFRAPEQMRIVNITEVPLIETGAELTAGEESSSGEITIAEWWNLSLNTPCNGTERFYTGSGFMKDWEYMIGKYNKVYCSGGEELVNMQPPENILKNASNYDCEDMAHATRCLADRYNVTCSFWINKNIGKVVPKSGGHLGVCCDIMGSWKCI